MAGKPITLPSNGSLYYVEIWLFFSCHIQPLSIQYQRLTGSICFCTFFYRQALGVKGAAEYEPQTDSWTRNADFPGRDRINGVAFSVDGKGYYGAGEAKDAVEGLRDLWQYNPQEDKWEKFTDFPGSCNVKLLANTYLHRFIFKFPCSH